MSPAAIFLFGAFACKKNVQTEKPVKNEAAPAEVVKPVDPAVEEFPPDLPADILELSKNFQKIHFDIDSYALNQDSKTALEANIGILQEDGSIRLEIQGHADERGTTDYNLTLGHQRAHSVYRYITANGISSERLKVVSYGEERPLDQASSESSWTQNRRCEFVIIWADNSTVKGSTRE